MSATLRAQWMLRKQERQQFEDGPDVGNPGAFL
jgi:hypothetical protein